MRKRKKTNKEIEEGIRIKEKKVNWYDVVKEIRNYKHKVGDVIYPYSEEGIMLRKKKVISCKCWAVVEKVNKKGYWNKLRYMYNNETADLYGLILSGRKFLDGIRK